MSEQFMIHVATLFQSDCQHIPRVSNNKLVVSRGKKITIYNK